MLADSRFFFLCVSTNEHEGLVLSVRTKTHINYCYEHVLMCILTMKFDKSHVCISPPLLGASMCFAKPKLCPQTKCSFVCLRLHSLFKFSACRMLRKITDCNLMAMVVRLEYFGLVCSFSFCVPHGKRLYIVCVYQDRYLLVYSTHRTLD